MPTTADLIRELDVLRGALRTSMSIVRKMKRGQSVDTNAYLRICSRVLAESREVATEAKKQARRAGSS